MEKNINKKYNFFFNVSRKVIEMNDISDFQKLLFIDILFYCEFGYYKKCIVPNATFSGKFQKTPITISKNIAALVEKNLIIRKFNNIGNRELYVNAEYFYSGLSINDNKIDKYDNDININDNSISKNNNDIINNDNQNNQLNNKGILGMNNKKNVRKKNKIFFINLISENIRNKYKDYKLSQLCLYLKTSLYENINNLDELVNYKHNTLLINKYINSVIDDILINKNIIVENNSSNEENIHCLYTLILEFINYLYENKDKYFNIHYMGYTSIDYFGQICKSNQTKNIRNIKVKGYIIKIDEIDDKFKKGTKYGKMIIEDYVGNKIEVLPSNKIYNLYREELLKSTQKQVEFKGDLIYEAYNKDIFLNGITEINML